MKWIDLILFKKTYTGIILKRKRHLFGEKTDTTNIILNADHSITRVLIELHLRLHYYIKGRLYCLIC